MLIHSIDPFFTSSSRVLILGSFPSPDSRAMGFFYGNKQNRFWPLRGMIFSEDVPSDVEGRKAFLSSHSIALWDVIRSCEIEGSDDSTIREVKPNDISSILSRSKIERIYTNGGKASSLYRKLIYPKTHVEAVALPSTSARNASWNIDRLYSVWSVIRPGLT